LNARWRKYVAETTLTIRIDDALKERLNRAATAEDRSATELVTRLVRAHIARQCSTCGRSDQPAVAPAGLAPVFNDFIENRKAKQNYTRVTITTLEGTRSVTHWGRIDHMITTTGMLVLRLQLTEDAFQEFQVAIPRGIITGWEEDHDGRFHSIYVAQGYVDGNARLLQSIIMAQRGFPIDGGRGRQEY
jgi:hypothetical protein